MLTVEDLTDALGLSKHQVRRRIKALDGLIEDHIKRGKKSRIEIDSGGLELLRTLEDLRDQGRTIEEAVEEIWTDTERETSESDEDTSANQYERQREGLVEEKDQRIQELKEQVDYLRVQVDRKEKQLEEKEEQIKRLLPGDTEEPREDDFKKLGLIQLVKKWLTTKT